MENGHFLVVKLLIKRGVSTEVRDGMQQTPLQIAVQFGHVNIVKFLIDNGADILATDDVGWSSIHHAALNDQVEVLKYLIEEKNVDIGTKTNQGQTVFQIASLKRSKMLCKAMFGLYVQYLSIIATIAFSHLSNIRPESHDLYMVHAFEVEKSLLLINVIVILMIIVCRICFFFFESESTLTYLKGKWSRVNIRKKVHKAFELYTFFFLLFLIIFLFIFSMYFNYMASLNISDYKYYLFQYICFFVK